MLVRVALPGCSAGRSATHTQGGARIEWLATPPRNSKLAGAPLDPASGLLHRGRGSCRRDETGCPLMQTEQPAYPLDFGEVQLDGLQRHAFDYFLNETNPANGLVADTSMPGAPASIAAVGFALAAYPVGVERGWMTRTDAIGRTSSLMRFLSEIGRAHV